ALACARVGRDPATVALLPVSKAVPPERLRAALAAGMTTFAENRVQEAAAKAAQVAARWELVGRLQSNKVRRAVGLFDVLHSVDSLALARRISHAVDERGAARLPIYLQVNVDEDAGKAGFAAAALDESIDEIASLGQLQLRGLMTVGRLAERAEDARATFVRLRRLSEHLRRRSEALGRGLSMGMSDDFEVAVEEGATVVRIGRAIFGSRPAG
ncbi:MAG: YggS family pyridoxal phosphate-dependent enzyme, partial [Chloroflexota bacterium]|nr:YggS family pyridoxal phosphate-dependent enzyme [Chloroflexota bacterium]